MNTKLDMNIFSKEQMTMIKESLENHVSLNDISQSLGKSKSYLTNVLKANQRGYDVGFQGEQWDNFRSWIKPILFNAKHSQTPLSLCNEEDLHILIESLRCQNVGLKVSIKAQKKSKAKLQEELKTIHKSYQAKLMRIDSLEKLCSKQEREISELKRKLQNTLSESNNKQIKDLHFEEVERYKRIIDMMLDKQC